MKQIKLIAAAVAVISIASLAIGKDAFRPHGEAGIVTDLPLYRVDRVARKCNYALVAWGATNIVVILPLYGTNGAPNREHRDALIILLNKANSTGQRPETQGENHE